MERAPFRTQPLTGIDITDVCKGWMTPALGTMATGICVKKLSLLALWNFPFRSPAGFESKIKSNASQKV
jgi:hypothetical protein